MPKQKSHEPQTKLQLRLPVTLARHLKHRAVDHDRSLNAELVHRLKKSVEQETPDAKTPS